MAVRGTRPVSIIEDVPSSARGVDARVVRRPVRLRWLAALAFAGFVGLAYGPELGLPFIGDDYVFLDKTRDAAFTGLWSFQNVDFGWYRPWSRELHFWALQHAVGLSEIAFRSFGLLLWCGTLLLYGTILRRLISARAALIAVAGAASLALWGTPLLWISGGQDLWMLFLSVVVLRLFLGGHRRTALPIFGLALLSKETAAALPAILSATVIVLERRTLSRALRTTLPFWALDLVWVAVHPTLLARLLGRYPAGTETLHRPPIPMIASRTVLATINLDAVPSLAAPDAVALLRILASTTLLAVGLVLGLRCTRDGPARLDRGRVRRFALVWAVLGWLPLLLPSIAWHAYYGCLGALGAWLLLGSELERRPRLALAAVVALGLLRGMRAETLSWDWGSEWYQRRAGRILAALRMDLLRQHPTLPADSRVFFVNLPNNIGLVAGRSPALRVWYRDSTLEAGFYSDYRARGGRNGRDFFFRFDPDSSRLVEVLREPEDVEDPGRDAQWARDHQELAVLFLQSGGIADAAREFEKVSMAPGRSEAAGFAAICWERAGDSARADSLARAAITRLGLSREMGAEWLAGLRRNFPVARLAVR